ATCEMRLELRLELVERVGVADRDELRRIVVQPVAQRADRMDLESLEVGVTPATYRRSSTYALRWNPAATTASIASSAVSRGIGTWRMNSPVVGSATTAPW